MKAMRKTDLISFGIIRCHRCGRVHELKFRIGNKFRRFVSYLLPSTLLYRCLLRASGFIWNHAHLDYSCDKCKKPPTY